MAEDQIAVSKRLIEEGFNEGNLDLIDELCSENFVAHDPLAGDQDREASKASLAMYRSAFPDLHFTIEDAIEAGDKVILRWKGEGTFENEFMGLQPTHERGEPIEGITIDRFEGGELAESWTSWNTFQLMKEIGAVPEQATA
jgi:predicted ester cyclase